MFHFHRWGAWSAPFVTKYDRPTGHFGDVRQVERTVQTRACQDAACAIVETRVVHDGTREEPRA